MQEQLLEMVASQGQAQSKMFDSEGNIATLIDQSLKETYGDGKV